MMEATFGRTALCDTENNGLSVFTLDADDDWSKDDGCATETNPLLLLLLLFWGLFLPWGARLSLAAAVQRPSREDVPGRHNPTHLSIASKALIFQVLAVYFFSAFLKNGDA